MKLRLLLTILTIEGALFLTTGCCRQQYPTVRDSVKDSISVERHTVARDTIIKIPGDSVSITIPYASLNNDSTPFKPLQKNNGRASLKVTKQPNNDIQIACKCDSASIAAKVLDTYIKEHRQVETTKTIISPSEKYIPRWVKILAWIGGILLLLVTIALFLKIKKII